MTPRKPPEQHRKPGPKPKKRPWKVPRTYRLSPEIAEIVDALDRSERGPFVEAAIRRAAKSS